MTNLVRVITILLLMVLISSTLSCSSDDDNAQMNSLPTNIQTKEDLTTYFEEIIQVKDIPGFAINIVSNNNISYQESFGFENIEENKYFNNETVINIASVSKTFVASATVKAIEQGHFTLNTPINDLLPVNIVNLKNPDAVIKIKHLVTHTSGIIDNPNTYLIANYFVLPGQQLSTNGANILINSLGLSVSNPIPLEEYLAAYFLEDGELYGEVNFLNSEPGENWSYSNVATALMGFIIESVTQVDFATYVKSNIMEPLQMHNTTYNVLEVDLSKSAVPYLNKNTPFPFYGNHGYPEGSIHTTNTDLGYYLLDMTQGIKGQSTNLFGSDYYELLFSEQLDSGIVPNFFAENHGIYWYKKANSWVHGGNSLGVSSHIEISEDGSYGFAIISNMDATFSDNSPKWEEVLSLLKQAIVQYLQNN